MKLLSVLIALAFLGIPLAAAEDQGVEGPVTVTKTKDGLRFQLPPDWPVEKRGGAVGPIPVEEYLSRKFSAVEKRLQLLEQQVGALDLRVRVLEERIKKQDSLKSSDQRLP